MPTLYNVPIDRLEAGRLAEGDVEDDGSVTILPDESVAFENHDGGGLGRAVEESIRTRTSPDARNDPHSWRDRSNTLDDSITLFSPNKPEGAASYRRRNIDLDSDVSLSYDTGTGGSGDAHSPLKSQMGPEGLRSELSPIGPVRQQRLNRERPWPHRDEYQALYQDGVKATIFKFQTTHPGKLRDYRSMSLEEKEREQQFVLSLLTRLGLSRGKAPSDAGAATHGCTTSRLAASKLQTSVHIDRRQLLDETLSPTYLPHASDGNHEAQNSALACVRPVNFSDYDGRDKSELLLSMDDDGDNLGGEEIKNTENRKESSPAPISSYVNNDSFCFPVNHDDVDSDCSMEVVRQAPIEEGNSSDDEKSFETPEDQIRTERSFKRHATSSGKRGGDLQRTRHNEDIAQSRYFQRDEEVDLAVRLERLSITPPPSSPPRDLFMASQSPISPRLTYGTPHQDGNDSFVPSSRDEHRVSWGRDSADHQSTVSAESIATNTPSKMYQSMKDKRRAFREVPVNVTLKEGATFHIDKLPVKRTERETSMNPAGTTKLGSKKALQRRRLVSFPDPIVRYNSRQRRALTEIYSWINKAELEHKDRLSNAAAVGVFFSLSDDQIIALSMKLLLHDSSSELPSKSRDHPSSMRGATIVILRSKEDTAVWESALREGTGCSVLNHATLPLSERIRSSTSEKACRFDVVLSTYDAMKSPDTTIPITVNGHATLRKAHGEGGWHVSRPASTEEVPNSTNQLSVLHRVSFRRIIFVDSLGRKCFLAKGSTARAAAAVALNGDSRLIFFGESEADGSSAIRALQKSDRGAFKSVSAVLRLVDSQSDDQDDEDDDSGVYESPLESVTVDFKDYFRSA